MNSTLTIARCQLIKYIDDVAECIILLDDMELPSVGFPASILRQKNVKLGERFHWNMRTTITSEDIDVNVPQTDEMTDEELKNLDRLYEEFKKNLAEDGGVWPEAQ